MNSFENLYVAAGFREDCTKLISQFEKSERSTFDNFSKLWNNMRFSGVFTGRASYSELKEFAEETLDIAKEFISSNKSLKIKIGGVYLLYGLFFTMPISQVKIRMTFTEWQNVMKLRDQFYHSKQFDAIFILKQLIEKKAFAYSICEYERGLENYYLLKDFMRGNSQMTQSVVPDREWIKVLGNLNEKNKFYLKEKEKLSKFSHHLVPKIFDITEVQTLEDAIKKLNADNNSSLLSSAHNDSIHQSLTKNENLIISASTSRDPEFPAMHVNFDSSNESYSLDDSNDEDQY